LTDLDLARRLPWLLVFRATVATVLLFLTLVVDLAELPSKHISPVLYAVVIGSYVVVLVLGLLLRTGVSAVILSAVHLAAVVMAALMVVGGTGGVSSGFTFLYLLAILDGAIIGGRRVALVVATVAALAHGLHLALQLYGVVALAAGTQLPPQAFASSAVVHLGAFFFMAGLAGYLAEQVRRAREVVRTVQTDLVRAEKLQAAVLESLPVGVITLDAAGYVHMANAAAGRILAAGRDGLTGKPLPAVLLPFVESGAAEAEREVSIGGEARWLLLRRCAALLPSRPADNAAAELWVLVAEDRTAMRDLQMDLRAKERLAGIGQLAASLAHELRNPLAAISGSVEMLAVVAPDAQQSEGRPESEQERLRAIVLREIDRLNELVADFLIFARPPPPSRLPIDLVGLVRELCAVACQDEICAGHRIEQQLPQQLLAVVDAAQIRQVLWNLLRNAMEASPQQAAVNVAVGTTECEQRPWAWVEIRDRGPGIAPTVQQRLFEPFCTTKANGSGLGLAVVHSIVEGHGGKIELRSPSALGAGTCARVLLPLS
jgi:two-component system sensor histidine kinase PilS (NtrC family)